MFLYPVMSETHYQKLQQTESEQKKDSRWLLMWRIVNATMALFFTLSSFVQVNMHDF